MVLKAFPGIHSELNCKLTTVYAVQGNPNSEIAHHVMSKRPSTVSTLIDDTVFHETCKEQCNADRSSQDTLIHEKKKETIM